MEKICNFLKTFSHIQWNTTSMLICATPLVLVCVLLHLSIFVFDQGSGAVVSNHGPCAKIGEAFLEDGGSVIDAAIGTMLCESVKLPNRAGIGGGFTALMFINGRIESLTATPIVPSSYPRGYLDMNSSNIEGAKAGGVPGELRGYWDLHQKYGILPWKSLFQPAIKLCENGIAITDWLELDIQRSTFFMYKSKTMRELYRTLYMQRDNKTFKLLKLAETLKKIAQHGPDVFYKGQIGKDFVDDVRSEGGFLTRKDLFDYKTSWGESPIEIRLPKRLTAYTTPLPSMGAALALAINVVKSLREKGTPLFWHTVIEATKHALGHSAQLADIENESQRNITREVKNTFSKMIDSSYAQKIRNLIIPGKTFHNSSYYGVKSRPTKSYGTSNICILSPKGNAIVMASSLMWDSQTFFYSNKTGIIFNNLIRNFLPPETSKLPSSYGAYVRPGKRALSPHCPVIVLNKYRATVYFIAGASGSALIPSQVITALIHYCLLDNNAYYAANSGFFAPDVLGDIVQVSDAVSGEVDFEKGLLNYLDDIGHVLKQEDSSNPYNIRTCIGHARKNPDVQFTTRQHGLGILVEPEKNLNSFLVMLLIVASLLVVSVMIYEITRSKH